MVEACHAETGIKSSEDAREAAVTPLLEGSPHGAVWLIGPRAAPVGYIAITFSWSLASGGLVGRIDEFFIRDAVRGRGVGTEVLVALIKELEASGLTALHREIGEDARTMGLYRRLGFAVRGPRHVVTWQRTDGR